ncbi:MAG: hypothetical protein H6607_01855 [Flavobacteriales bacterium]|nr:hypothetical protein [Flavobacteriales bacterium]
MKQLRHYFEKINQRFIRTNPLGWVLGVHIFWPLILVLGLLLFVATWLYPLNPLPDWSSYRGFFSNINQILILPAILLFILFIIRQIKFNTKRVHLKLPYSKSFFTFVYFFITLFAISALPFVANVAGYLKAKNTLKTTEFEKDIEALVNGYTHFYLMQTAEIEDKYYTYYEQYYLNETKDSLIFRRDFPIYPSSSLQDKINYRYNSFDTIPLNQVYEEMRDFMAASGKYEGDIKLTDPHEILRKNVAAKKHVKYQDDVDTAYNHFKNHFRFENQMEFYDHFYEKSGLFWVAEIEFWQFYLFLALAISALLFIVCHTDFAHFGWGMLVATLHPTVFGILLGTLESTTPYFKHKTEIYVIAIMSVLLLNAIYFAFFSKRKVAVKRAFAIALHIFIPIVLISYVFLFEELINCCWLHQDWNCNCHYAIDKPTFEWLAWAFFVMSVFATTYIFGRYYRRKYINPS